MNDGVQMRAKRLLVRPVCRILIVVFLCTMTCTSIESMENPQSASAEFELLKGTLAKIGPVRAIHPELFFSEEKRIKGVTFCWEFEADDPTPYKNIERIIHSFVGQANWQFRMQFNGKGACITGLDHVLKGGSTDSNLVIEELRRLRELIEEQCRVTDREVSAATNRTVSLEDPNDPGMYSVLLTRAERSREAPVSEDDRMLHFGPTYDEWFAFFFGSLHLDAADYEHWRKQHPGEKFRPLGFGDRIPEFPILSRLNDVHESVRVSRDEVEELERECLRSGANISDQRAQHFVDKMLLICAWAKHLGAGFFLLAD